MKNKIVDLNNHLFAQLERLGDETLSQEKLEHEIQRTRAIVDTSEQIVKIANTSLKAAELYAEYGGSHLPALPLLGLDSSSPSKKTS